MAHGHRVGGDSATQRATFGRDEDVDEEGAVFVEVDVEDGTNTGEGRAALCHRGDVCRGCGRRVIGADGGLDVRECAASKEEAPYAGMRGDVRDQRVGIEWALKKAHAVGWLIRAFLLGAGEIDRDAVTAALCAKFTYPARKNPPDGVSAFR